MGSVQTVLYAPYMAETALSNETLATFFQAVGGGHVDAETETAVDRVRDILSLLPPKEADMVELYYFQGVGQYQIAKLFGYSQPSVHHRLKKAAKRIRFWASRPPLSSDQIRDALTPILPPEDVEIMILMAETTSQARTGRAIRESQSFIRYRFHRSLRRIEQEGGLEEYARLFTLIAANLNVAYDPER